MKLISRTKAIEAIRALTGTQKQAAMSKIERNVYFSPDGCWYWISGLDSAKERGRLTLLNYTWYAHRAAYELYVGPITEGLDALHTCDNKLCVNPNHLFLGTDSDNQQDFWRKGRTRKLSWKGERNVSSKLNNEQVFMIRELSGYLSQKSIAIRFDVSVSLVCMIQKRRLWKHL